VSLPTSVVSSAENTIGTVLSTRPSPTCFAVDVARDIAALAEVIAVGGELHPHLMIAGRNLPRAVDLEAPVRLGAGVEQALGADSL
jgi:hypothetical protein